MGVAIPRALVGSWVPGPPQKFVGQLLTRNEISQTIQTMKDIDRVYYKLYYHIH